MGWNDREPLPAVPGSLTQHSGSLLNLFGVAGGPYVSTGNLDFAIFKLFSGRFFSYHTVVPWNDWELLPANPGTLKQHSGSLLSISGGAGGPV